MLLHDVLKYSPLFGSCGPKAAAPALRYCVAGQGSPGGVGGGGLVLLRRGRETSWAKESEPAGPLQYNFYDGELASVREMNWATESEQV